MELTEKRNYLTTKELAGISGLNPDVFSEELSRIHTESISRGLLTVLVSLPAHFYTDPAATKYHSPEERVTGGLILHTKRVCAAIEVLIECSRLDNERADVLRSAALLHDCAKFGLEEIPSTYSLHEHPVLAADLVEDIFKDIDAEHGNRISGIVLTHMGFWGDVSEGCLFPYDLDCWLLHYADCMVTLYKDPYEKRS